VHGVLRVGVWHVIKPVSLLFATVLWPGAASLEPIGDLAHGILCDPMQGLYRD
jgi:hypothetical protein